jgi:signal peptidase II
MAGPARTLRGKWVWLLLAAVVMAADLWTKEVFFTPLTEGRIEWVAGDWFGLTKVWNKGMMWGVLQEHGDAVLQGLRAMRVLAAVVVLGMVLSTPASSRLLLGALGLVLGGALGNIYDGFVFDRVRDFLYFDFDFDPFDPFPVFNLADSAICVGVGLLALGLMLDGKAQKRAEAEGRSAADGDGPGGEPGDAQGRKPGEGSGSVQERVVRL